jgi:SAM-dependent methyltransferase
MAYHETRFSFDRRREVVWKTLCDAYFQKLIAPDMCVLDLGAGYAHFINNVRCRRRIALDKWEGMNQYVAPGIETHIGPVSNLDSIGDASVDFVFASNIFEHLTQEEFARTLAQLKMKLRPGGTLNILQPNYRFCYREYFDDFTHISVYSDRSLCDFLKTSGYRIVVCEPKFTPLSVVTSRLPVWAPLIKLYLHLPFKPLGKQMLVRAQVL